MSTRQGEPEENEKLTNSQLGMPPSQHTYTYTYTQNEWEAQKHNAAGAT